MHKCYNMCMQYTQLPLVLVTSCVGHWQVAARDGNMDLIKLPAQECGYHVHVIWQCAV